MMETRNAERGTRNEPAKRPGWRKDEFARHEVYTQMLWLYPWAIVIAIIVGIWLLRSCAAPSAASG
jgi:hypothetical protein